jgi:hypothetical protein
MWVRLWQDATTVQIWYGVSLRTWQHFVAGERAERRFERELLHIVVRARIRRCFANS